MLGSRPDLYSHKAEQGRLAVRGWVLELNSDRVKATWRQIENGLLLQESWRSPTVKQAEV
jgi:hypothetical protein